MPDNISASVTFCDDVRFEVGGKITIVGVYRGILGLDISATSITKLVALVLLRYPPNLVGLAASIRVMDRGKSLLEAKISLDPSVPMPPELLPGGVPFDCVYASVPVEIHGFVPEEGARLYVVLDAGDFHFQSDELFVTRPRTRNLFASSASADD